MLKGKLCPPLEDASPLERVTQTVVERPDPLEDGGWRFAPLRPADVGATVSAKDLRPGTTGNLVHVRVGIGPSQHGQVVLFVGHDDVGPNLAAPPPDDDFLADWLHR